VLPPLISDGLLQYHYWLEMEGVSAVPELVAESHESMSIDQSSLSSKKGPFIINFFVALL